MSPTCVCPHSTLTHTPLTPPCSNVGAVFTIIGALAGILWSNIMRQHGLHMSYG